MHVRKLQSSDMGQVTDVFTRAYGGDWSGEDAHAYLNRFRNIDPDCCLVGVRDDGHIAGGILGYSYPQRDQRVLYVQELFVQPDDRHQGWGRRLLEDLRDRFDDPVVNVKPLVNAPATVQRFYDKLGLDQDQSYSYYDNGEKDRPGI